MVVLVRDVVLNADARSSASFGRPSTGAADRTVVAAIYTIHPVQRNGSRRTGYMS